MTSRRADFELLGHSDQQRASATLPLRGSWTRHRRRLALGVAGVLLGLHGVKYAELNDYIEEYLSGMPRIERNTTLLPIAFSQRGEAPDARPLPSRINVLLNVAG